MDYIGGYILLNSKEMLELFNHIGAQDIYVVNSILAGLVFTVTIAADDNCAAKYVSV